MSRFVFVLCIVVAAMGRIDAQDAQQSRMQAMIKMTEGLSAGTLRSLGGITCWTCHRGNVKPARMPRASWEDLLAKWPEELKLSAENAKKPRRDVYKNIQSTPDAPAGGLPMAMSIFAAALGVGCEHCHVPGRWDLDEKPAKVTARLMLGILDEIPRYFEKNQQPVMQCYTCHQGSPKPQRHPNG
jgi:hypothetical protein